MYNIYQMLIHRKLEYVNFKYELIQNDMSIIITFKSFLHFQVLFFKYDFFFHWYNQYLIYRYTNQ